LLTPDHHEFHLGTIDRADEGLIIHCYRPARVRLVLREDGKPASDAAARLPLGFSAYYLPRSDEPNERRIRPYACLSTAGDRGLMFDTHPEEEIDVRIDLHGYSPYEETLRLAEGEGKTVEVNLEQDAGPRTPKITLKLGRQEFLLGESIAVEYELTNSG